MSIVNNFVKVRTVLGSRVVQSFPSFTNIRNLNSYHYGPLLCTRGVPKVMPVRVYCLRINNHNFLSEMQYCVYTSNKPMSAVLSSFDVVSVHYHL